MAYELVAARWRMAIEVKSVHDDAIQDIGQLVEAVAHGYSSATLVTSLRHAKTYGMQNLNHRTVVPLAAV